MKIIKTLNLLLQHSHSFNCHVAYYNFQVFEMKNQHFFKCIYLKGIIIKQNRHVTRIKSSHICLPFWWQWEWQWLELMSRNFIIYERLTGVRVYSHVTKARHKTDMRIRGALIMRIYILSRISLTRGQRRRRSHHQHTFTISRHLHRNVFISLHTFTCVAKLRQHI